MTLIAAGVICMWPGTAASIPAGWTRVAALDGKYPKGTAAATNPGTTGGSATHNHTSAAHLHSIASHTHTAGTAGMVTVGQTARNTGGAITSATSGHTHTTPTSTATAPNTDTAVATWAAVASDPANFVVIFIESDGTPTKFPTGAIVLGNDGVAPPIGAQHTGSKNRFFKGAAAAGDGGGTGGAATHAHGGVAHNHTGMPTHTHTQTSDAPSATELRPVGIGQQADPNHAHAVTFVSANALSTNATSADTGTDNGEPAYKKVVALLLAAAGIDEGVIALWAGTLASIPTGWSLCDGSNGTPDLRGVFPKMCDAVGEIGDTGGSAGHAHTSPAGHLHANSVHDHATSYGGSDGTPITLTGTASNVPDHGHIHSAVTSSTHTADTGSTVQTAPSTADTQPPFSTVAFIMAGASFIPSAGDAAVPSEPQVPSIPTFGRI